MKKLLGINFYLCLHPLNKCSIFTNLIFMKKFFTLLFLLFSFFVLRTHGQTFLSESFDGASLPTGWHATSQTTNWSISNSDYAGKAPRELKLTWNPQFNGITRMVSPVIDLTGATDLVIAFSQYLDNYTGSHIIGIETTSDGGTTWNLAFQKTFGSTQGSKITEKISTPDVGSANFQFCLFYQGNSYNINDWYFDDFEVFARYQTDATIVSINNPLYNLAENNIVTFSVQNVGKDTIKAMKISYQFNDEPAVIQEFNSLIIKPLASQTLSFTQNATVEPGNYILKIEILTVNGSADDNPLNNVLTKNFYAAIQSAVRKVCIEHFTSSTCGPCVSVNTQMKSLLANNEGKFGISKYQMSWPGSGDPYYTAEGGVRRTYYGVNAVPMVFFNAKNVGSINQNTFNTALAEPAFVEITGNYTSDYTINGKNVVINCNVLSYLTIPEARLYVIVNEKRTTKNQGGNGEKEFFHVMMKILPSAQGETISMEPGETKNFNYSFDMSSTKVEEMEDLEVHVFLQEHSSKYIFNSSFLDFFLPEAPDNIFAEQVDDDVVLTWDEPEKSRDDNNYTLLFNGAKLAENITTQTYTHENVPAGVHTYGVAAVKDGGASETAETHITICGNDPDNLLAEQVGKNVVLTWDAEFEGTYSFTVFCDGAILAENITTKKYIHTNVPGGMHTYGVLAVVGECDHNTVETPVEVCAQPKNFVGKQVDHSVELTWNNQYGTANLLFNGQPLAENIEIENYTHEDVPEGTHTYTIQSVGMNCISDIVKITVKVIYAGVNEYNDNIKIYPNPANNYFVVEGKDIASILIHNSIGQLVTTVSATSDITRINTKDYPSGLYHLQVITKSGTTSATQMIITK